MRTVALDAEAIAILRAHQRRQREERLAAGEAWKGTGFVFTQSDGVGCIRSMSDQFLWLAYLAGLATDPAP